MSHHQTKSVYGTSACPARVRTQPGERLAQPLAGGQPGVAPDPGGLGVGRLFSSIGLHDEIADVLNIVNFFGSDSLQYDCEALKQDAIARAEDYADENAKLRKTFHLFPRIWKAIGEVAQTGAYDNYREKLNELETETPTTIRHLLDIKKAEKQVPVEKVDISVGEHSLPFVIASMSFGSQK